MWNLGQVIRVWTLALVPFVVSKQLGAQSYQRAADSNEVVKRKIYPKDGRVELSFPNIGFIMNQSYVNTFLISGGVNYFFNETMGIGLDVAFGANSDKDERYCIERFYYDPNNEVGLACGEPDNLLSVSEPIDPGFPRYGPAYVPIRELDTVFSVNMIWAPVYGKQLLLMRATSYFDLYFEAGMGLALSTFYQKRDVLANDNVPRDVYTDPTVGSDEARRQANERNAGIGALPSQVDSWGDLGRPPSRSEQHVMLNLGVGQKFHFAGRFHLKVNVRNMTLLGTDKAFESLFALSGGAGMRF